MTTFFHAGKIGDLIYSLNFCLELMQYFNQSKFNYHIQTNVPFNPSLVEVDSAGPNPVLLNRQTAQFIKPLLEAQPYINQVSIGDQVPADGVNLNNFRLPTTNTYCGDIRDWYYQLTNIMLPRDFFKKIIFAKKNQKYKDQVLFTLSQRYINCNIDYKQLKQFKDQLVFLGTKREYKVFCSNYFKLDWTGKQSSLQEVAELIEGAKGYVANQTGLFALAEGLKVNRILMTTDYMMLNGQKYNGPVNVLPLGGACCTVNRTSKLVDSLKCLLA